MRIELFTYPDDLQGLTVAPDFGAIVRSARLLETMGRNLGDGAVIAAAVEGSALNGYATVMGIAPDWRRFARVPGVIELGAIEVARSARRRGLGTALVTRIDRHAALDNLVTITYGASSHWEPEPGSLGPGRYRRMLLKLLGKAQFVIQDTDDPEVLEHPLNFLAARIGPHVAPGVLLGFLQRLYEERPLAMTTAPG